MRLNQAIAIEKATKAKAHVEITEAHQALLKPALLTGISRRYTPKDEEGEQFPPEANKVQVKAEHMLKRTAAVLTALFDVTATKDYANCSAKADVAIDGQVLLPAVPVTYLLFLEKQLVDIHTFVKKLPVLDPGEDWKLDPTADCWATAPTESVKTKKIPRNHVRAEATKEHPAQVDIYTEDVVVGHWKTVKFSGALPEARVNELVARVEKLQRAVKFAREEANSSPATEVQVGEKLFGYLFA